MTAENQMDIKINAKANANFDHLLKAMPKGFAMLCKLCFGKREADITRYQMLTAAQTEKECQQIFLGECVFKDGSLVPIQNLMQLERLDPMQTEIEQENKNLAGNLQIAAETLNDIPDEQISDKEVDEDFFARWRREAKVIGNKELQRLWGRLLAEEIKEPESISFRALDILKNITSNEARLFQKIAPYISKNGTFICTIEKTLLPEDVSLASLVGLRDAGLIANIDDSIVGVSTGRIRRGDRSYAMAQFKNLAFISVGDEEEFYTPGITISSAGRVALSVCDFDSPNEYQIGYLSMVLTRSSFCNVKKLVVCRQIGGGETYEETPIFSSSPDAKFM